MPTFIPLLPNKSAPITASTVFISTYFQPKAIATCHNQPFGSIEIKIKKIKIKVKVRTEGKLMGQRDDASCEAFMAAAIEQSELGVELGFMPFGAVLVVDGRVVLKAHNCIDIAADAESDVTRHAEMELVRKMCAAGISREQRKRATLYTSTEPCVMCAGAIVWSGVETLVYGCSAKRVHEITPGGFDVPIRELFGRAPKDIKVKGPFCEEEALAVHRGYWPNVKVKRGGLERSGKGNATLEEVEIERSLRKTALGYGKAKKSDLVPVIDLAQPDAVVEERIWNAASTVGFFTIVNHGIDLRLIDAAFDVSKQFFEQDLKQKKEQCPYSKQLNSGYEFMEQVRPSTGTADQKESMQITYREGAMDGRWPKNQQLRDVAEELTKASHALAQRLLNILQPRCCPSLPAGTLAKAHTLWAKGGQCTLRLLHYPPTQPAEDDTVWRAGPHTDWDCLTFVFQRMGESGLECAANPRAAQTEGWVTVDPVPGGIAVNVGDMLGRWSDGRVLSNLHRADKEQVIESETNEPITAGDYIMGRIKSNFAK